MALENVISLDSRIFKIFVSLIDLRSFKMTMLSLMGFKFSSFSLELSITFLFKLPLSLILLHQSTFLSLLEFISLFRKVDKFIMDILDLNWTQSKCLSIYQALDCIQLVHDYKIWILMLEIDCLAVRLQKFIIKLIVASLFDLEIHYSTAYLKKILNDILGFTCIFSRL